MVMLVFFFFQAEDGIRDADVTGVQTCALPISIAAQGDGETEGAAGGTAVLLPRGDQVPGIAGIGSQGWLFGDVDQLAVAVAGGDRTRLADDAWGERAEGWWRRGRRRLPPRNARNEDEQSRNRTERRGWWARHASALLRLEDAGHLLRPGQGLFPVEVQGLQNRA